MHVMEVIECSDFQKSWLQERIDPEEYFLQQTQTRLARREQSVRDVIEHNRRLVMDAWVAGDEVWSWSERICEGISIAYGLALLQEGEIIRVWFIARAL